MGFCWFAQSLPDFHPRFAGWTPVSDVLLRAPGVTEAHIFTPGQTDDPYLNDGQPPAFAFQVYFDNVEALEEALGPGGLYVEALPRILGGDFRHQAMLVRPFSVPDANIRQRQSACTYLVAYEGAAEDLPLWLSCYLGHHAPIMTRFPDVRSVEVYTRIDWCDAMPTWQRADHMQRNKIVFDDAAALTAALHSPVRHEMRADFLNFPPFTGPVSHFPMTTRILGSIQE